jgi:hypothetical protein
MQALGRAVLQNEAKVFIEERPDGAAEVMTLVSYRGMQANMLAYAPLRPNRDGVVPMKFRLEEVPLQASCEYELECLDDP